MLNTGLLSYSENVNTNVTSLKKIIFKKSCHVKNKKNPIKTIWLVANLVRVFGETYSMYTSVFNGRCMSK